MKATVDIDITPQMLAAAFAEMGDEDQAQFFIEVAAIADGWTGTNMSQWHAVGRHLRSCKCSTDSARDLVLSIAHGVDHA